MHRRFSALSALGAIVAALSLTACGTANNAPFGLNAPNPQLPGTSNAYVRFVDGSPLITVDIMFDNALVGTTTFHQLVPPANGFLSIPAGTHVALANLHGTTAPLTFPTPVTLLAGHKYSIVVAGTALVPTPTPPLSILAFDNGHYATSTATGGAFSFFNASPHSAPNVVLAEACVCATPPTFAVAVAGSVSPNAIPSPGLVQFVVLNATGSVTLTTYPSAAANFTGQNVTMYLTDDTSAPSGVSVLAVSDSNG